jgi:hypothetical protein
MEIAEWRDFQQGGVCSLTGGRVFISTEGGKSPSILPPIFGSGAVQHLGHPNRLRHSKSRKEPCSRNLGQ